MTTIFFFLAFRDFENFVDFYLSCYLSKFIKKILLSVIYIMDRRSLLALGASIIWRKMQCPFLSYLSMVWLWQSTVSSVKHVIRKTANRESIDRSRPLPPIRRSSSHHDVDPGHVGVSGSVGSGTEEHSPINEEQKLPHLLLLQPPPFFAHWI